MLGSEGDDLVVSLLGDFLAHYVLMVLFLSLALVPLDVLLQGRDLIEGACHLLPKLVDLLSEPLVLGFRLVKLDLLNFDALIRCIHLDVGLLLIELGGHQLLN